jgi:2-aminoethylphosphonate-pyruvate transaminase
MLLLNPGPVSVTERVRRSLLQPDLCHREPEFFDLQDEARRRLLGVYGLDPAEWTAVLLTGSGTAAVESMLAALVPEDGRVLIVENGVYGERMSQMASRFSIGYAVARHGWMSAVDAASVGARLDKEPGFTHVAVVHHETTTGRLNDLVGLERLCRERGLRLLVDAVSSFGAEPIDFRHGGIVAAAATANKCLHGVPGVAFVVVRRDALPHAACRSYYLDLSRLALLQDRRDTPFTPSVPAYYALVEALTELEDYGGWVRRHEKYHRHARRLANALASLGIHALIPDRESSVVLRAYRLPPGMSYVQLHDRLKADGFVIYAGQGALAPDIFRISVMGDLHESDLDRLALAFQRALQSLRAAHPEGSHGRAVLGMPTEG